MMDVGGNANLCFAVVVENVQQQILECKSVIGLNTIIQINT